MIYTMDEANKYYYLSPKSASYSSIRTNVINWNKNFYIEVDENVEFKPCIVLTVGKFSEEVVEKPKSSDYQTVKPILQEIFFDHYHLVLKQLNKTDISEGEFYLITHNKDWFEVLFFPSGKKQINISIDFRDSIESLWLIFCGSSNLRFRPSARKKGTPIPSAQFKQIMDLTLKYLYDKDSLKVLLQNYIKNFKHLCDGEIDFEIFKVNDDQIFKKVVNQLNQRKRSIEQQLIENDNYSESERIKMRGEIEGINYALETIKTS